MKFEEEILLLSRGIKALEKQAADALRADKQTSVIMEIVTRRNNLTDCLTQVIFERYGQRSADYPHALVEVTSACQTTT